jgi:four helix bundle protein
MALNSYRDLQSWQIGMELVESIYRVTQSWPSSEQFGLTSQSQRSAVSVPLNIAEGYGRLHRGEYIHHLSMAKGSLCELETLLTIAERVGAAAQGSTDDAMVLAVRVGQMLTKQIRSLKATG